LTYFRTFNNHELLLYDLRFRLRPPLESLDNILIIEISDDTLKNLGSWPLPRDFHASLVNVLKELKAKIIVFDMLFSEPSIYDNDLSSSIKKAGNVYFPLAFYTEDKRKENYDFLESKTILADIEQNLKHSIAGFGQINISVDSDGKIRKVPLFIKYKDTLFPQLAFRVACDWLKIDIQKVKLEGRNLIIEDRLFLPILQNGIFLVNFPDRWNRSFQRLSYFEILKSYADIKRAVKPSLDLSVIKDKVCFIGLTATGASDLRPTPLENIYPMVGLQASVFNSIIQNKFIRDTDVFTNFAINFLVFILSVLICLKLSTWKAFIGSIIFGLLYFLISTLIFIFFGIWIELFFPILITVISYICISSYRFFDEAKKRRLLEKELEVARTIQKSFLPQDIKGFSSLRISSFLQPAKFVAGDLYDIQIMDEIRLGVLIGDVSGKGVPAALIMAQTLSLFRVFIQQYSNCSQVLTRLNQELYGKFANRFVTCIFMIIDTREKRVAVCSAGQGPLFLYQKSSHALLEVGFSEGFPLGIVKEAEYKQVEFNIDRGDKIIVFTDGVSEIRNREGKEFGIENIKSIILENADCSADKLSQIIRERLSKFSYHLTQDDDITLVILANQQD
jgi:CHASE2 domain-containing sensor protein